MCKQGMKVAERMDTGPAGAPASREKTIKRLVIQANSLSDEELQKLIRLAHRLSSQIV